MKRQMTERCVCRAILSIASQIFPSAYSINISKNNINEQNSFIEGHASKVNNNVKIKSNVISRGEPGVDYQQDVISGVGGEREGLGGGWAESAGREAESEQANTLSLPPVHS